MVAHLLLQQRQLAQSQAHATRGFRQRYAAPAHVHHFLPQSTVQTALGFCNFTHLRRRAFFLQKHDRTFGDHFLFFVQT